MEGMYTTKDIASQLHVKPTTVRRWIKDGKLIAKRIGGGLRITHEDYRKFVGD